MVVRNIRILTALFFFSNRVERSSSAYYISKKGTIHSVITAYIIIVRSESFSGKQTYFRAVN